MYMYLIVREDVVTFAKCNELLYVHLEVRVTRSRRVHLPHAEHIYNGY